MSVLSYALPVSALIVIPIERMVRFLGMLVKDPLGYQKTKAFHQFVEEEEGTLKKTGWRKEVVDGMETSFLMSTITRISNLMKVGFGSAGVEIIRSNLEEGAQNNVTFGNLVGSTVSCIFLFGDIRQFTDASECLQEEVFVFTNRIASVVHSICNSFDGSANKNIGDAFLVSWLLDSEDEDLDENDDGNDGGSLDFDGGSGMRMGGMMRQESKLVANDNQADKALLSVVRICIALHHDDFYLEDMSEGAKKRLKEKMSEREGPLVQMGFGLHAGKAVQGAIGSERKLDATYISTAVDLAEYLESSTKKYGIKMLMSGEFYGLLAKSSQRRCRKIDQITLCKDNVEDNIYDARDNEEQDIMELYTHDMVVEDAWVVDTSSNSSGTTVKNEMSNNIGRGGLVPNNSLVEGGVTQTRSDYLTSKGGAGSTMGIISHDSKKDVNVVRPPGSRSRRRSSVFFVANSPSNENNLGADTKNELDQPGLGELSLPSGRVAYNASIWLKDDLRRTRRKFSHGSFYGPFNTALQSYFKGEWKEARNNFERVAERFDDNPSKYFLKKMKATNYVPPMSFIGYSSA